MGVTVKAPTKKIDEASTAKEAKERVVKNPRIS
ncbi:hypothetical protein BH11BAC1_BH11BAC1_26090 [soil metagenome]